MFEAFLLKAVMFYEKLNKLLLGNVFNRFEFLIDTNFIDRYLYYLLNIFLEVKLEKTRKTV